MRPTLVFGSIVSGLVVLALHVSACSSDDNAPPPFAEGGTIVEPDGALVTPDAAPDVPDTSVKPSLVNVTNNVIQVAGDTRAYVLSVPKTYDASRSYPLIVALHGDGQNADGFRQFLNLDDLAGNDAITAYTDGVVELFTPYDQNGDQQLVEAVINEVKGKLSINASKIWGFGYSKGGFMLNELACRKPGMFSAIAGHAAGAPSVQPAQCPGIVGLPFMMTEGDKNTDIGASFAAQYWAGVNGCGANLAPSSPPECSNYQGCPAGKPVVYCLAPGVTHFPIWNQAATVSWTFFKSL